MHLFALIYSVIRAFFLYTRQRNKSAYYSNNLM